MSEQREPSALERLRRLEQEERARPSDGAAGSDSGAPSRDGASGRRRGLLGGAVAFLLILLTKGKVLLLLLATKGGALLSALKFGKLATTLVTMGASIWYYASLYHWKFALGLVVLILVHELGHGFAAKRLGLKVGAPIFIPGFGAVIALKEQPRSTWVSAIIGYGGPLAGTLGGVVVLLFGRFAFDAGLATVLAHVTFLLNCFNLVPVGGLDGDRISEPLERSHWGAGLFFTAVVAVLMMEGESRPDGRTNPQLVFVLAILLLGIVKAIRVHRRAAAAAAGGSVRLVDRLVGREAGYTDEADVRPWQRRATAIAYFGLVGLLTCLAALSEPPSR